MTVVLWTFTWIKTLSFFYRNDRWLQQLVCISSCLANVMSSSYSVSLLELLELRYTYSTAISRLPWLADIVTQGSPGEVLEISGMDDANLCQSRKDVQNRTLLLKLNCFCFSVVCLLQNCIWWPVTLCALSHARFKVYTLCAAIFVAFVRLLYC